MLLKKINQAKMRPIVLTHLIFVITVSSFGQRAIAQTRPEAQENVLKTLLAGLRSREQILENKAISGSALDKNFLSEAHWRSMDITEELKIARQKGTYLDRDMALLRFNLSKDQWFYEIQQLLWSGWSRWFQRDYNRKATDVWNLYSRTACDGENIYRYTEERGRPTGFIEPLNKLEPGLYLRFFYRWLSVGFVSEPFSQTLSVDGVKSRVGDIHKEKLGDQETYVITEGINSNLFIDENRAWIAPDLGFTVVKWENLSIDKKNPKSGTRFVAEWSQFKNSDGVMVPYHCLEQEFSYKAERPDKDTWQVSRDLTFQNLQLQDKFVPKLSDYVIRAGTFLDGFNGIILPPQTIQSLDAQKIVADDQKSREPWRDAAKFRLGPLPEINQNYKAPLTGDELHQLVTKYGFNL